MKKGKNDNKMATSKAMAQMRDVAWGMKTKVELHRLEVRQAARDDNAVMAAAEAKRLRKAEKAARIAAKVQA